MDMRPVRREDGPEVLKQENIFKFELLTLYRWLCRLYVFKLLEFDLSVRARALKLLLALRFRNAVLAVYVQAKLAFAWLVAPWTPYPTPVVIVEIVGEQKGIHEFADQVLPRLPSIIVGTVVFPADEKPASWRARLSLHRQNPVR